MPESSNVVNTGWDDQEDELDLGEWDKPDEAEEPITNTEPAPTAIQASLGWDEDEPLDIDGVLDQPAADAGAPTGLDPDGEEKSQAKGPDAAAADAA